jgi:Reverse transcriptase (RNA-dependent DNA polymerase)
METYAPTASLATFRLLVAISVFNGWQLRNLDIITAFLNGDIDTEVFMGIPEDPAGTVSSFFSSLLTMLY